MSSVVSPILTAFQVVPLSTLLNTPLSPVPTYNVVVVVGSMASVRMSLVEIPLEAAVQVVA